MSGDNSVSYFSIKLSSKEESRIKVLCAKRAITLKTWYRRAFEAFISERIELEKRGERRLYRARPVKAKYVSVGTDSEVIESIKEWAIQDNVRYSAAYYTAVIEHLEKCENKRSEK